MLNMNDMVGKKVFIRYDINLMLPYVCTVIEVNDERRMIRVKEFNKTWYSMDDVLCYTYDEYTNMILFMKRQLDALTERNKQAEKDMKEEILNYIDLVNLL